jgi:hypothetical protein
MPLDIRYTRQGGYTIPAVSGGLAAVQAFGAAGQLPAMSLAIGPGNGVPDQANTLYRTDFSVAFGVTLGVDLKGGGGEKDVLNVALSLSRVVWLALEITNPGAGVSLQFGPQNITNAWQGPWGGVTALFYSTVIRRWEQDDPYAGWGVVDATHKILGLKNPAGSGNPVTGTLLVAGW